MIMTVRGPVEDSNPGKTLTHEHVIIDFRGAEYTSNNDYEMSEVIDIVYPFLEEIKDLGYKCFVDCTPQFFGRDVLVLRKLSELLDIHILTSTGCFAAGNDKHIPSFFYGKDERGIAKIWVEEWNRGIGGTGIKPGIIKVAVDKGPLSEIDNKIVSAACITYHETGLTIMCHTGEKECAMQVLEIIKKYKVPASKLIIAHADSIEDKNTIFKLADEGCYVEYDWIGIKPIGYHVQLIKETIEKGFTAQILLSQDAGQYSVGEKDGGKEKFRPYTYVEKQLIPELIKELDIRIIDKIQKVNPLYALSIQ